MKPVPILSKKVITAEAFEICSLPTGDPILFSGDRSNPVFQCNFSYLKRHCGQTRLDLMPPATDPETGPVTCETSLDQLVAYLQNPEASVLGGVAAQLGLQATLFSIADCGSRFAETPLATWRFPSFVDNWMPQLRTWDAFQQGQPSLLLLPTGFVHSSHHWFTSGLYILQGSMKHILVSPADSDRLASGVANPFDLEVWESPTLKDTSPLQCTTEAPSVLFAPPNWRHFIQTLEPCAVLFGGIVNRHNFGFCLVNSLDGSLDRWLESLPAL